MLSLILLGALGFALALALTPAIRNRVVTWGWAVDHPDSHRKIHASPMPRLGGMPILLSYALALMVFRLVPEGWGATWLHETKISWLALAGVAVMFLTGLVDDLKGLRPWQKLSGQVAAAFIVYASGVRIHVIQWREMDSWMSLPVTILWLVICSNAFNLIDGMDGLAAGVGFLATSTMFVAAVAQHNIGLAIMTLPLCGALLGFLRYNFNPASIFLGDCGSLSIGFILGCFGVLWGQKSATLLGMTAPVMALAVPLLDASISIARRFLRHQPIFSGDRRHLHHRLLDMGLTHRKAVLMLYGGCGLAALFSLVQNRIHDQFGGVVVVLFCGLAWIGIQYLGYVEFGTATKLIVKGRLRKVVDAEVRLQLFEQRLNRAASLTECWETIRSGAREFGFTGVRLSCAATSLTDSFGPPEKSWQVRVPLRDDQYINFYCNFGHDRRLDLVSGFISIVEHSLTTKSILSEVSPKNPPRRGPQPLPAPAVARAVSGSA